MPPLHPAIVHVPLALIPMGFVADWIGFAGNKPAARMVGWWCLLLGLLGGAVSIALGYFDMNRAALADETHTLVHMHLRIGWLLAITLSGVVLWRWRIRHAPGKHAGYLVCCGLVVALTLFQGWFGGEMVYSHGAGVAAAQQGMAAPDQAKAPLSKVHDTLSALPGFQETQGEHASSHAEHEKHRH